MIEFLKSWVINIVTLVIFIVLLEILLPSGKIKKFINLVSGFILIIAIISPFVQFIGKGIDLGELQISGSNFLDKKEIEADSKLLEDSNMKQIVQVYRNKLIKRMEDSVGQEEGIRDVKADVIINEDYKSERFGEIQRIYLEVSLAASNTDMEPVSQVEKVDLKKEAKITGKKQKANDELKKRLEDKLSKTLEISRESIVVSFS